MQDINVIALVGFVLRTLAMVGLLIWVVPEQIREIRRPAPGLKLISQYLFIMVTVFILVNLLPLTYTYALIQGTPPENFRSITSIAANLAVLIISLMLILIYRYRVKD